MKIGKFNVEIYKDDKPEFFRIWRMKPFENAEQIDYFGHRAAIIIYLLGLEISIDWI